MNKDEMKLIEQNIIFWSIFGIINFGFMSIAIIFDYLLFITIFIVISYVFLIAILIASKKLERKLYGCESCKIKTNEGDKKW